MAKKEDPITKIRKQLGETGLIVGKDETMKLLKINGLKVVFLASNCSPEMSSEIKHYAKLANTEIVDLEIPNDELGIALKKPFFVSVIGKTEE